MPSVGQLGISGTAGEGLGGGVFNDSGAMTSDLWTKIFGNDADLFPDQCGF